VISPLCDKDWSTMTLGELVSLENNLLHAYLCDRERCSRCYHETTGYFDFIAGQSYVADRQTLCEFDAHAMYLESIRSDGEQTWRCPECSGIEQH